MAKIAYIEPPRFQKQTRIMLDKVIEIVTEFQAQNYRMTLRQLYYQLVSRDIIPNRQNEYAKLSGLLTKARMAGLVDWDFIEDRIRVPKFPNQFNDIDHAMRTINSVYRLDRWKDQQYYAEVWVEKDALSGVLEPITRDYHVHLLVNRGYSSASAMHDSALRIREEKEYGKDCKIFYFGDHDPSGEDMVRDIQNRLNEFGCDVDVEKVALTMEQIEQYNPPPNPVKMALALDTLLPTPSGWITMQDLKIGDYLLTPKGKPCKVLNKSKTFSNKICYEFTFSGGAKIISSADHLWKVIARKRSQEIYNTEQIARKWLEGKDKRPIYRIPIAKPLSSLPNKKLPIPPYVLGAWLGDGNTDGEGRFACSEKDNEILNQIEKEGFDVLRRDKINCTIYGLRGKLFSNKLAHDKHIPISYLRSSLSQRLSLLQGLMDTDGTISINRNTYPCSYTTILPNLANQIVELLSTLGIKSRISIGKPPKLMPNAKPSYRIEFYPKNIKIFRLKRKQDRLKQAIQKERQRWRTITNVRLVDSIPTQCIVVDSPDHLFLATEHFIATHNSDSRANNYVAEHGGESWELDALAPNVLVDLVRQKLDEIIEQEKYDAVVELEDKDKEKMKRFGSKNKESDD